MAQLTLHRLERVVDHLVQRLMRAIVFLLFIAHQLVTRADGDINPASIRISLLMGVTSLLDRDIAPVDVIAKFVEPRGIAHHQVIELI